MNFKYIHVLIFVTQLDYLPLVHKRQYAEEDSFLLLLENAVNMDARHKFVSCLGVKIGNNLQLKCMIVLN